jgi:hypothetical protein
MSCHPRWAGLPTRDCLKMTTLVFRGGFFDVVTVVCFLVQNIAVHFEYQKHVHFRNGHMLMGWVLSFVAEGPNITGCQQRKCKSIGVSIYFMNNDVGLWKLSDFWFMYRYMCSKSSERLPYLNLRNGCHGSGPLRVKFIFTRKICLTTVTCNLMFYSFENGESTSYWN